MKSKLIVLGVVTILTLSYSNYVLAHVGHEHKMAENSKSTKAVEVGNKFCPVTGDKIPVPGEKGTMGDEPVKYEYNGKIYNLCCTMCVKDFKKNPKKYSKVAEDEVAKEKMMEKKEGKKGAIKK